MYLIVLLLTTVLLCSMKVGQAHFIDRMITENLNSTHIRTQTLIIKKVVESGQREALKHQGPVAAAVRKFKCSLVAM